MTDQPGSYAIVFRKEKQEREANWSKTADEILVADAEIRELAEASEALRAPERPVYTLS